ncbi:hypothetical protein AAE02nite_02670 [Adhaeribacter aerolatus]|uniref:DUF4168 domain-containing protein n=1 Tax=Adhaeribacter aerolatus TaxID=670289 RepID=A0A512ASB5_9BACT|nr:hypothetical protein [Adhaeribacter aerolatus]GEO02603.1 hypothetical protein AAE02nite_02670 [Adhaeribacter aerolatus]
MKKLITSVFLLLVLVSAQAADTPEQIRANATKTTRELAQKLGFNEQEYIKVKAYTLEKLIAVKEVSQMYSNDADMRNKKLQAIEEEYQKNVVAVLSPKQTESFMALVKTN